MLRLATFAIGVIVLAGCASTKIQPLNREALAPHQGGTATLTVRDRPAFVAVTAGKAMFAAIGGAAMVIAGNKIVRENEVEDPAGYIGAKLLEELAAANALKVLPKNGAIAKTTDVAELAKLYSSADILLDVQTTYWNLTYFPTDWNSYGVNYFVKLRLIDNRRGKVLAEGFCKRTPQKTDSAPSHDQLLENKAAGLKRELLAAADHCLGEFRDTLLKS